MPEYATDRWPDEDSTPTIVSVAIDQYNHAALDMEVEHVAINKALDTAKCYRIGSEEWIDHMDHALDCLDAVSAALRRVIDNGIALRSAHIARAEKQSTRHNYASGANTIT
jgi:hypothetical protein